MYLIMAEVIGLKLFFSSLFAIFLNNPCCLCPAIMVMGSNWIDCLTIILSSSISWSSTRLCVSVSVSLLAKKHSCSVLQLECFLLFSRQIQKHNREAIIQFYKQISVSSLAYFTPSYDKRATHSLDSSDCRMCIISKLLSCTYGPMLKCCIKCEQTTEALLTI